MFYYPCPYNANYARFFVYKHAAVDPLPQYVQWLHVWY